MGRSILARWRAIIGPKLADYFGLEASATSPAAQRLASNIENLRARLGAAIAERRRIAIALARATAERGDLNEKADKAIALGRDDLARAAIERRRALDEEAQAADREIEALDAEARSLSAALAALGASSAPIEARLAELDALLAAERTPVKEIS